MLILNGASAPLELRTRVDERDADLWRCAAQKWAHTCHAVLLGSEVTPAIRSTIPADCPWPIVAAPASEYLL